MKKLVCAILMFLVLITPAFADEITFRGIPWGSNLDTVLSESGWGDMRSRSYPWVYGFGETSMYNFKVFERAECYENSGCTYNILMRLDDAKVAGYDVLSIDLQFMYDIIDGEVSTDSINMRFVNGIYSLHADDYEAAYDDLVDKLTWLYGEPVEQEVAKRDFSDVVEKGSLWVGDNSTAVFLRAKYSSGDNTAATTDLHIEYGKTDTDIELKRIEDCLKKKERDDKYNAENTEGL